MFLVPLYKCNVFDIVIIPGDIFSDDSHFLINSFDCIRWVCCLDEVFPNGSRNRLVHRVFMNMDIPVYC